MPWLLRIASTIAELFWLFVVYFAVVNHLIWIGRVVMRGLGAILTIESTFVSICFAFCHDVPFSPLGVFLPFVSLPDHEACSLHLSFTVRGRRSKTFK